MTTLQTPILIPETNGKHRTVAAQTRRVYDRLSAVYPLSTLFFHSTAHKRALSVSGLVDGMRVLEAATGSGEMFRRLVRANRTGETIGFDLSPNMAARTHRRVQRECPAATTLCQAVDARYLPFRDESFDLVVCCYLLELLSSEDIERTLGEIRRVLRVDGRLALVAIGQNTEFFNRIYRVLGKLAPAFWGRQIDGRLIELIEAADFRLLSEEHVRQTLYPSRVLVAAK